MADIAELIVALRLQDGVSRGLGNLNRELRGMQGGLGQVGRGIGQVGTGLDRIATRGAIAAAAGLTAVVTAAVSFEDAFAGVRKTVDASEGEFGQLEDQLREMARTIPVSFEELAGITEAGGALGIAFEGLDEFTRVVADLAATTDLSADQAATSLGVLGNVLNLRAEDFDNFGSALVDLGNKGASTESQILDISERIGATGALIGLTSDQVLGFGAAVANVGIEAEAGGSALQRFFIDALTAVEGGGEDLETFARTAGQTADVFRDSFRDDAGEALNDFIIGLGKLPEAVQIETLADLGFNDVRITRTLLGLATDADNLTDSLNISATAFAENSALGVEAAKRYGTAASQIKILKQNVTDAAVVIGEQLLPVVAELTGDLVEFINKPDTQRAIKEFGENLASGIRSFVEEVRRADLAPLMDTLRGAAAIAKGAFDAFRSLPAPIQQLAIAAIVANKVTGGAVGSIASGLTNIIAGSLKIAFFDRGSIGNPMYVVPVGGGLGGAAAAGGTLGRTVLGITGVGLGLLLAEEFEEEIDGLSQDIALAIGGGKPLIDIGEGPSAWQWPFGSANPPDWLPEFLGGPGPDLSNPFGLTPGEGREILKTFALGTRDPEQSKLLLPGFSEARNVGGSPVLPDTAMQPLTDAITPLVGAIEGLTSTFSGKQRVGGGNFVETVKLDPSQVTDLREPTRLAAEKLRMLQADAAAADTANRTASNFLATEAIKNRMETSARLTMLAGKYDQTNAHLAGVAGKLDAANSKLAAINAKNFSPTIKVENKTSNTVIQNNITQNATVSGFYRDANVR